MATVAEEVEISEEIKVEEPTKLVTPAPDGVDAAKVDGSGATAIDPPADGVPQEDAQVSAPVSTPTNDHPEDVVIPDPPEPKPEHKVDPNDELRRAYVVETAMLEAEVDAAEEEWDAAKEEAAACKKVFDNAVEKLRKRVKAGINPMPLFNQPAPVAAPKKSEEPKPRTVNPPVGEAAPPPAPKPDDSWRALPMSELEKHGLKESIINKLDEHDIRTLGTLTDRMNKHGQFWTKDIKGFGEAKFNAVADAFEAFWKANPQYCRDPKAVVVIDEDTKKIEAAPHGDDVLAIVDGKVVQSVATETPAEAAATEPAEPVDPRFDGKSDDFKKGYLDYENGVARKDNPHSRGSTNWHDWIDGFNKAMEDAIDADTKGRKQAGA